MRTTGDDEPGLGLHAGFLQQNAAQRVLNTVFTFARHTLRIDKDGGDGLPPGRQGVWLLYSLPRLSQRTATRVPPPPYPGCRQLGAGAAARPPRHFPL